MKRGTGLGLVMLLTAASPAPPGASSCSGCHGSAAPIAGREAKDITEALIAFRSGARPSTVMGRIAKGFDPDELGSIAAWWAARK
jgi:sulfide dehydrogenase cytochrome subunit